MLCTEGTMEPVFFDRQPSGEWLPSTFLLLGLLAFLAVLLLYIHVEQADWDAYAANHECVEKERVPQPAYWVKGRYVKPADKVVWVCKGGGVFVR